MAPVDVATFGETMGLLTADTVGPLRFSGALQLGYGGAESNLATGVVRLGRSACWMGRVGDDEFGELILSGLRGEGVDVSFATVDPDVPTALMVKERRTTRHRRVTYYRRDLAGARLAPEHLSVDAIRSAAILHVSAITSGLSGNARRAVEAAIDEASDADVLVSVDLNHRAAVWSAEEAAPVMRELARRADVVFASHAEAIMTVDRQDPTEAARVFADMGATHAFVKLGADGAVANIEGEEHRVPAVEVPVVDPVGAGDAFAAGYLTALLDGEELGVRLRRSAQAGAFAVTVPGDWEGLPTLEDLGLLEDDEEVAR